MELWIRSQDKESLLMIKKVFYHCTCNEMESLGEHYIGNKEWVGDKDYTLLGKYKTKERALEILDEIQERILNLQLVELEERGKARKDVRITPYLECVYNMPEE